VDLDPRLCDQLEAVLALEAPYTSSFIPQRSAALPEEWQGVTGEI